MTPRRWKSGATPAPPWTARGSAFRAACCAKSSRTCPGRVRPACPQPGQQCAHRRRRHGLRAGLRLALRARSGRGPALRDDRGFPQFREAGLYVAGDAPFRRHDLRAGGPAGQQAPSRHGGEPYPLFRQGLHGLGHRAGTRAGYGGHGEDRLRRRFRREQLLHHQPDQRQLADDLRRHHAGRAEGLCAAQPGLRGLALHPVRRHEPGDGRRAR